MHRSRKQAVPRRNCSRVQEQAQALPHDATTAVESALKEKFSSAPFKIQPSTVAGGPHLNHITIQTLVPEVSWIGSLAETFGSDKLERLLSEFIDHELLQTLQNETVLKKKSEKDALFHALFAVHLFTATSPSVFRAVNAALRASEWDQLDSSWKQFVRAFAFGARYLEMHSSTTTANPPVAAAAAAAAASSSAAASDPSAMSCRRLYRGVAHALAADFATGDVLVWPEIVSCTESQEVARSVATGAAQAIFELRDPVGASCNIQPLSLQETAERQHVFLPGTQFRVVSVHVPAAAAASNEPEYVVLEALATASAAPIQDSKVSASGGSHKKRGSAVLLTEAVGSAAAPGELKQKKAKTATSRTILWLSDRSEGSQTLLDEARGAGITVLQARDPHEVKDRLEAMRRCSNSTFRILADSHGNVDRTDAGVAMVRALRALNLPQKVLVYVSQLSADLCQTIATDLSLGNVTLTADLQVAREFTQFVAAC